VYNDLTLHSTGRIFEQIKLVSREVDISPITALTTNEFTYRNITIETMAII